MSVPLSRYVKRSTGYVMQRGRNWRSAPTADSKEVRKLESQGSIEEQDAKDGRRNSARVSCAIISCSRGHYLPDGFDQSARILPRSVKLLPSATSPRDIISAELSCSPPRSTRKKRKKQRHRRRRTPLALGETNAERWAGCQLGLPLPCLTLPNRSSKLFPVACWAPHHERSIEAHRQWRRQLG